MLNEEKGEILLIQERVSVVESKEEERGMIIKGRYIRMENVI